MFFFLLGNGVLSLSPFSLTSATKQKQYYLYTIILREHFSVFVHTGSVTAYYLQIVNHSWFGLTSRELQNPRAIVLYFYNEKIKKKTLKWVNVFCECVKKRKEAFLLGSAAKTIRTNETWMIPRLFCFVSQPCETSCWFWFVLRFLCIKLWWIYLDRERTTI